jgi:hypothetical protein
MREDLPTLGLPTMAIVGIDSMATSSLEKVIIALFVCQVNAVCSETPD